MDQEGIINYVTPILVALLIAGAKWARDYVRSHGAEVQDAVVRGLMIRAVDAACAAVVDIGVTTGDVLKRAGKLDATTAGQLRAAAIAAGLKALGTHGVKLLSESMTDVEGWLGAQVERAVERRHHDLAMMGAARIAIHTDDLRAALAAAARVGSLPPEASRR